MRHTWIWSVHSLYAPDDFAECSQGLIILDWMTHITTSQLTLTSGDTKIRWVVVMYRVPELEFLVFRLSSNWTFSTYKWNILIISHLHFKCSSPWVLRYAPWCPVVVVVVSIFPLLNYHHFTRSVELVLFFWNQLFLGYWWKDI